VIWLVVLSALFVAYVNGANDNFKGVATLFGSGTTGYRKALIWATLTTLAGSAVAIVASAELIQSFSGRGLVPDALTRDPHFLVAAGTGAALTVLLASLTGIPVSTTHALVGGLIGAGLAAPGAPVAFVSLQRGFVLPLLLSPVAAIGLTLVVYLPSRAARHWLGIEEKTCFCVGDRQAVVAVQSDGTGVILHSGLRLSMAEMSTCRSRYAGTLLGVSAQRLLEGFHFISAGAVSFARGLNDTPKIAALLVAGGFLGLSGSSVAVACLIAMGGWLSARRVAETMAHKITAMNEGQGFSANLATAVLVGLASLSGLPVSTTHVSVGSLFGIGLANGRADWKRISGIGGAWVGTLPLAGLISYGLFFLLSRLA
jgi:inorganic phosphate transporter, PiT family